MMPSSPAMTTRRGLSTAVPVPPPLLRQQRTEAGEALLDRQRGVDPPQLQPQLDQGDPHRRPDADDDGVRAEESRADGDVTQEPPEERIDRLGDREVEQHS